MSSIDFMSLYKRFGNFFKIHLKSLGKAYELGMEINDSIDKRTTIFYNGQYYSFEAHGGSNESELTQEILARFLGKRFFLALKEHGYEFTKRYCAYKDEDELEQPHQDIIRIFRGFVYRIVTIENEFFLCIDPHVILKPVSSIADLIQKGLSPSDLNEFSVRYIGSEERGIDGYLLDTATGKELAQELKSKYFCRINRYRKEKEEPEEEIVPAEKVLPESRPELIQTLLQALEIDFDVIRHIRSLSFLDSPTPSTDRFVQTMKRVEELIDSGVFPLEFDGFSFELDRRPIIIKL